MRCHEPLLRYQVRVACHSPKALKSGCSWPFMPVPLNFGVRLSFPGPPLNQTQISILNSRITWSIIIAMAGSMKKQVRVASVGKPAAGLPDVSGRAAGPRLSKPLLRCSHSDSHFLPSQPPMRSGLLMPGTRASLTLLISGAILALSPATIAWPRWVMTETLAAASVLWVFAEISGPLALRRLRILQLSLALATATLVRWDQIWLLVPAAGCAIYMEHRNPLNMCRQIAIMGFAASLLIVFMMLRAATVSLPLLPTVEEDLNQWCKGLLAVAAKNQSFERGFMWPIEDKKYADIASKFDYSSIAPGFDTARLRAVLNRITALPPDSTLPEKLDAELADLARNPSWKRGRAFTS